MEKDSVSPIEIAYPKLSTILTPVKVPLNLKDTQQKL